MQTEIKKTEKQMSSFLSSADLILIQVQSAFTYV